MLTFLIVFFLLFCKNYHLLLNVLELKCSKCKYIPFLSVSIKILGFINVFRPFMNIHNQKPVIDV